MFNTITKYLATQIQNEAALQLKELHYPKFGVSVALMPAKIAGCFQPNWKRVTVTLNPNAMGHTCNGDQYHVQTEKVMQIIRQHNHLFEKQ